MNQRPHNPAVRSIEPPDAPDYLSSAVLTALARPVGDAQAWSLGRTLLTALVTFGLAPLLGLSRRFDDYARLEQQQLWHLAEWLRLHSPHPQAPQLRERAAELRPAPLLRVIPVLSFWFVLGGFFAKLAPVHRPFAYLFQATFGYARHRALMGYPNWSFIHNLQFEHGLIDQLAAIWIGALVVGYGALYLMVQLHALEVRRFIDGFNKIAVSEGLTPIAPVGVGLGIRPLWLIGGLAIAWTGAVWALMMVLAAGLQQRYIRQASRRNRAALAQRLREMLLRHRPQVHVPSPMYLKSLCAYPLCRAPLLPGSRFCGRCGHRVSGDDHVDRVA